MPRETFEKRVKKILTQGPAKVKFCCIENAL